MFSSWSLRRRLGQIAIVAALALVGALQIGQGTADARGDSRTLHPGWNLISWLAPPMSAEELFQHAELSSVERMTKWGDDATIASVVSRHSEWMHSGWHVGPGDSLWLFLERETTLQPFWLGEDDHSGVTHALRAGVNSVYWSGQSDSVLSDVAASLPDGPIVIGAFDSSSQQFEWFSIRGTAEHRQRTTLNISYGDVIIVYSAHPAEWTQPYRMQANLIFGADVPYDDRQVFAAQLAELEQALTNRFGLPSVTFDFYLARTWDGLYDAFESQGLGPYSTEQRVTGNHCANPGGPPHWIIGAHCRSRPNPADSSFVQGHLRALGVPYGNRLSSAMQLGFAAYVRRALLDSDLALAEHGLEVAKSRNDPRVAIATDRWDRVRGPLEYLLATFVARAYGEESFGSYFLSLADTNAGPARAAKATQLAFGASEEHISQRFASWRTVAAPPISASGVDRIQIVGSATPALKAEIHATILAVEEWATDKFNHTFDPPVPWLISTESRHCGIGWGIAVDIGGSCVNAKQVYAHEYFHHIQRDLRQSLRLPDWYTEGTARYVDTLFSVYVGEGSYNARRGTWVRAAKNFPGRLSDRDLVEHYGPSYYMGALATEWLVALAGESSYYELLKQHGAITSFPIAFERTFELDLDEFYRTYEIWRESGFPPDLAGVRQ